MARPKKVNPQVPGQPVTEPETETNVETVIAEEQEQPEVTEPEQQDKPEAVEQEQPPIVEPEAIKPAKATKQSIKPVLTDRGYIVKG